MEYTDQKEGCTMRVNAGVRRGRLVVKVVVERLFDSNDLPLEGPMLDSSTEALIHESVLALFERFRDVNFASMEDT